MGFRYRKTFNLGGGFRVNISKSGIGYSWGVKGFRVTKTSKGTIRKTASIPGTGISYVEEQEIGRKQKAPENYENNANSYETEEIKNSDASDMVSEGMEEMLSAARRTLKVNKISTVGIWLFLILSCAYPLFLVLFAASAVLKIYSKKKGLIDLEYVIDEDQKPVFDKNMKAVMKAAESEQVWRVVQTSKVLNKRYSGGAESIIQRVPCKVKDKVPFPFQSNISAVSFTSGKETIVFLPDKVFILQKEKIGALNYEDISETISVTKFMEDGKVPSDAQVVGQTWQHPTKSGEPDKRYKNNKQIPICLYGEIKLTSHLGLNTIFICSNPDIQ